ncbi:FAD-binding oxidoreductase [Brevibacterium samyangense]|uniref:FAD-linked oxidase C-terminal domain-containing protein n=1 Tax=Brevibacterium samyangense TaxID=366888 RepID=A0ABP5EL50_9MICO
MTAVLLPPSADLDLAPLAAALTPRALVTDPDVVAAHSEDKALFCAVGQARALVRAATIEDVQATLRFAHAHAVPVVPQGARTGLSGGANAMDGAILLNVAKMNAVLDVNPVEKTATVQPGVVNLDLKKHLEPFGLAYPPDPGSVAISSIGGNVATNAGGLCCVKYGVTRDYVRSLKVVLADGSLTTVGRPTAKGVAGFELSHLFVGSEGTLGVVVEVTLDLVPALPDPLTAVGLFPTSTAAARTVTAFMESGAQPSMLEFIDGPTIGMINAYGDFGLDDGTGAMLLVQSNGDGSPERAQAELESFSRIARENGATDVTYSDDPRDSELLVAARRAISPAIEAYCHREHLGELVDDVCVPLARMADFSSALDAISARYPDNLIASCAHAGDGNFHPCVFFDQDSEESNRLAQEAFGEIMAAGLALGGTITGEHGVGYLKAEWLAKELDPASRALHLAIKNALDPKGILNPGKMLRAL